MSEKIVLSVNSRYCSHEMRQRYLGVLSAHMPELRRLAL